MRFADIALNLTDPMFAGTYHRHFKHPSDLDAVVSRARSAGVERMLITGTSLSETLRALELAKRYDMWCTAGIHPTSISEIDAHPSGPEEYISDLVKLIEEDRGQGGSKRIVSIGEVGLDYDRLDYSSAEAQRKHLPALLKLSRTFQLPLFLHSRTANAQCDLVSALHDVGWGKDWAGGVVHSFTGTMEEMREFVEMGFYIGINGCSLKTDENLEVVRAVPLDRILLETDAPWCTPSASHASSSYHPPSTSPLVMQKVSKPDKWKDGRGVKGRMEPAEIGIIAHMVATIRQEPIEQLAEQVWKNSLRLFWPQDTIRNPT
ncbi:MAG: hypothetical protein TREMPRED_005500 [Tremellales sp. Tagirdzhanova-0007]|nr:MAG: hypothetical protein TREMPRED_005500 [Tremellales sp. Tagirdzhanova-0007]